MLVHPLVYPLHTDGHRPSFRENPPSASSPCGLLALEGNGENTPGGDQVPPAPELPTVIQHDLKCFQEREAAKALGRDTVKDRMG